MFKRTRAPGRQQTRTHIGRALAGMRVQYARIERIDKVIQSKFQYTGTLRERAMHTQRTLLGMRPCVLNGCDRT